MIIAVAVDDHMGMTFNKRRQSRDSALCADLTQSVETVLRINSYSAPLFEPSDKIIVSDDFLESAGPKDVCFVENVSIAPYVDRVDAYIIYRWNRNYPRQTTFDGDLEGYVLQSTTEFAGTSHDKITKEIYVK